MGKYFCLIALLAGLRGGLLPALSVVGGEFVAALSAQAQLTDTRPDLFTLWAPWLFMAFAVGLLGAWIRHLQLLQKDTRSSPYASAHHLLGQLRTVTRELSGGLDIEVSGVSAGTEIVVGPYQALRELQDGDPVQQN